MEQVRTVSSPQQNMATTFRRRNRALAEKAIVALQSERPMTLRQLYYRLVSVGELRANQREYKRLGAMMTRLREAGDIPRSWIVDHVRSTLKPSSWSGLVDFGDTVREAYRKDFWASLPVHVEIFVEKDAIAGTIQPVTNEYDVALRVCRGYASVSFAGEIADQWAKVAKPIHAYYIGDYDPSGFDIERDLREKLHRYSGRDFIFERIALCQRDFDDFDLITLPIKRSDRRAARFLAKHGDEECGEVDALPPSELRNRVRECIMTHIDRDEWERLQKIEEIEKETMADYVANWDEPLVV